VLTCVVLLAAASTPNLIFVDNKLADLVARKLGHLVVYFAIVFGAGITLGANLRRSHTVWLLLIGAIALALLDEAIQLQVAGRLSSPLDVVLDVLGAVGGIVAWVRYERWRAARS
jgi:VanZ family protein